MFATSLLRLSYARVLKPFFFRRDPETVHDRTTHLGEILGRHALTRKAVSALLSFEHPALEQTVLGIRFKNPIGLAAGFDKDAHLTDILPAVGFGFEEIGSVTGEPCAGNPKPRLWRMPQSQSLIVYYGLKNDGCEAVATRLRGKTFAFPIGTSIARTNSVATVAVEAGIADYVKGFRAFTDIGDYMTVNISCPNTCGGEPFTDPARLDALLTALDPIPTTKPIFLKLQADLSFTQIDEILDVCNRHRVNGFIVSNLSKDRTNPLITPEEIRDVHVGGVSGKPTFKLSNERIAHIFKKTGGRYAIIGCGGVFTAEDAYKKIRCGASLVQLITGMVFQGPQVVGEINRGLVKLLEQDGYASISEAVGKDAT